MTDKKALKLLFKRYWSSEGWTTTYLTKEELDYSIAAGVMFKQQKISHEDVIEKIQILIPSLSLEDVVSQFIASLSTRRLDLRSTLGSFIVGRHILEHDFSGEDTNCAYCGGSNKIGKIEDLNVLNFERFKSGGVRHLDPLYIAFDLEQFNKTEKLTSTTEDYEILNAILSVIAHFPPDAKLRDLEKALSKVVKSNKEEREVLLQILGFCSILSTNEHPGFINKFIPFNEREEPAHSKNDWSYPICWWRGKDRLNKNALKVVFPDLLYNN